MNDHSIVVILFPALAAVVGALVYALSANGKAAELGRVLYACGVFWLLYLLAGVVVKL